MMTCYAREPATLAGELEKHLPRLSAEGILEGIRSLWEEQRNTVRLLPGALSLLKFLKRRGLKLCVTSTTWHPLYESFRLQCPEAASLLDYEVLSYREGVKKPSLSFYRRALDMAEAPAAECWMIGDSYELDVEPALKLGMRTVWILRRPELERPALASLLRGEKTPPDWTAVDLHDVLSFFHRRLGS
jgi:FMN phosphatase YigB (HAD superfamily)